MHIKRFGDPWFFWRYNALVRLLFGLLLLLGGSFGHSQVDAVRNHLDGVANKLDALEEPCPFAFTRGLVPEATMVCYSHAFEEFAEFEAMWNSAQDGRLQPVYGWMRQDAPSGAIFLRLYELNDTGVLMQFAPGDPGLMAFLIRPSWRDARTPEPLPPAEARLWTPFDVMAALRAVPESQKVVIDGDQFRAVEDSCSPTEEMCTVKLLQAPASTVIIYLGLDEIGWRIQEINEGILYSTRLGILVLAIVEGERGVSVTASIFSDERELGPVFPPPK